jgi:hypothetical protein
MSKPKAKLETGLDEQQQAELCQWLLGGMPYSQAKREVQERWGVKVSVSMLGRFWDSVCGPALLAKRRRCAGLASEMARAAEAEPGRFDAATVDAIRQAAFEASIAPGADPDKVVQLFGMVLKSKDQDLKEQAVALQRRRLEILERQEQEAKGVVGDETLSAEQKMAKFREMFGLKG